MLGGVNNPSAWIEVAGERAAHDGHGTAQAVTAFRQGNSWVGIELATTVSDAADLWWAPVETVSNSEGGFERVYQGSGLLLSWPLALAPGASTTVTIGHVVATTHDRAVEDAGAAATVTIGA